RGLEIVFEALPDVPAQRVDGRIVDDDDGDFAVLFHRDGNRGVFGHGRTPFKLKPIGKTCVPAKAGTHLRPVQNSTERRWAPAFAGARGFFIQTYRSYQSSSAAWTSVLTSRRTG